MPRSLLFLLALVLALNYIDRSSLSTAAPLIQQEFQLSSTDLGFLLSAFFWVYTPAQILGGWLVHRFDVRLMLGLGVLVWGAATALTGLAGSFVAIFILRLVLALGECVTFPSVQLLVSRYASVAERGRVGAIISSGQGFGPLIGTLFGGLAMAAFGWRAMFLGLGALTVLWCLPWFQVSRERMSSGGPSLTRSADADQAPIAFARILQRREFWGMALGMFAGNYPFYFVAIWLPTYLVKAGGFSVTDMSAVVAAFYGVYALSVLVTGRIADAWTVRSGSLNRVWKCLLTFGYLGAVLSIGACAFLPPHLAAWSLGFAGICFGQLSPALYTLTALVPGPRAAGRWAGAQATAGQLAGVVSPIVTGFLIDRTGSYYAAFLMAAAGAILGLVCWTLLVPRYETIDWDAPLAATASSSP